jgi:hypothetical protein
VKFRRCPSSAEIARFFDRDANEGAKKKLLDHVRACPDCRLVFEATKEIYERGDSILDELGAVNLGDKDTRTRLRGLARREIKALREARRPASRPFPRRLAVPAAAAALAIAAAFVVLPIIRNGRMPAIERNAAGSGIGLVAPHGSVPAEPVTFEWTAPLGVSSCRLQIYDRALEPVYASPPLKGAHFTLPAGAAGPLLKRTAYFWKIVASSADGKRVESEFAKFIVQR